MTYCCTKCGRYLQSVDVWNNRVARKRAYKLYCPNCNISYRNPYKDTDKTPLWMKHPDLKKTKKGLYYRLENAKNGDTLILFHNYNWYPPTEIEIKNTNDHELIDLYYRIDIQNNEWKIAREESIPFNHR